jgi:hypothetical protein
MKNVFITLISFGLFVACAEKQSKADQEVKEDTANLPVEEEKAEAPKRKVFYPIASPEQMFDFISDNRVVYQKELINPAENRKAYVESAEKALNLGVYIADLSYAAAYQDVESTIDLYQTVRALGSEINIDEMMSDEMMKQVSDNLQNKDSLAVIAGRSYFKAVDYLEENGMQTKLALLSVGGWIEGLYISVNSIDEFDASSPTIQRIADQKVTFANLYTYVAKQAGNLAIDQCLKDLEPIRQAFASLLEQKESAQNAKSKGKLRFGGGKQITITEAQFNSLKEAVNAYRTKIVE